MKKIYLSILIYATMHSATFAVQPHLTDLPNAYGEQLWNSTFDGDWETTNNEPVNMPNGGGWHSFNTAQYDGVSAKTNAQFGPSTTVIRPGAASNSKSAKMNARSVLGVIANGNITNGQIYANVGLLTSTADSKNATKCYNRAVHSDSKFHTPFESKPDSITLWVNFQSVSATQYGRMYMYLYGEGSGNFQDPPSTQALRDRMVAFAGKHFLKTDGWVRLSVPFNYNSYESFTDFSDVTKANNTTTYNTAKIPPKYILGTLSTNVVPGGNAADVLYVDDILMIYKPTLSVENISGKSVFNPGNEIEISYTITGTMSPYNLNKAANVVSLELSNASGSFNNPVILTNVTTDKSGVFKVNLPASLAIGTGYKLRVKTTNYPMTSEELSISVVPPTYPVTVNSEGTGATGAGNYEKDATVTIFAGNAPTGRRFKEWTVTPQSVVLNNPQNATATFTMPAEAVTVTAVFEPIYRVTVNSEGAGATGTGDYTKDATVTIFAGTAPSGKRFKEWTVTPQSVVLNNAQNATTTFTMPAEAVTVTAVFESIYLVTLVSEGTGATGAGIYTKDATVTIYAGTTPNGKRFKEWTVAPQGVVLNNAKNPTTTFTMPAEAVTVTAVFESIYSVTVISECSDATGTGYYAKDEIVTIFAGTVPSGKRFKEWTVTPQSVVLNNTKSTTTTFTMPAGAVTLTAVFESIYPVTVVSEGVGATGTGNYTKNATVTIFAGIIPGMQLKEWTVEPKSLQLNNPKSATTTFTMPAEAVTVTAVFEPKSATSYPVTIISEGVGATGTGYYEEDETVTLYAGTALGMKFKEWIVTPPKILFGDGIQFIEWTTLKLDDTKSETTTFTMPAEAVIVTAIFEPIYYPVTVNSEGNSATGTENYKKNEIVKIFAGIAPSNMQFKEWTVEPQSVVLIDAKSATTTFTMPAEKVTVTAVFENITDVSNSIFAENTVSVYPNPVSEILFIKGEEIETAIIYTVNGVKISEIKTIKNGIDVSNYAKGLYIITVKTTDGSIYRSLFVKN